MALGYRQPAFQGYRSVTHGGWRYFESIQSVRQCSPLLFRGKIVRPALEAQSAAGLVASQANNRG
jgi:hypothetical protein